MSDTPPGVWEGVAGWCPACGSAQAQDGVGAELGPLRWWHSLVAAWRGWGGGDPGACGGSEAGLAVVAAGGQSGDMGPWGMMSQSVRADGHRGGSTG